MRYWTKISKNEKEDMATQVRVTLGAVHWKDRWDVYILKNMHTQPVEGYFTH
jgi:Trm5-related predicted tRNA methylase